MTSRPRPRRLDHIAGIGVDRKVDEGHGPPLVAEAPDLPGILVHGHQHEVDLRLI